VTVNARIEEEVDEGAIVDKVAKASGSSYNFNRSESKDEGQQRPVVFIPFISFKKVLYCQTTFCFYFILFYSFVFNQGSIYKRVNASQEIDTKARDSFWAQEEQEEKKRQLEEQKRKEEERKRREEELKHREVQQ
jgi:hypothetical protein